MKDNIILSADTQLQAGFKKNMNVLVLGVPGSGKTRGHILPNLSNLLETSAILLDPKGELYTMTAEMMQKRGFSVKILDFDNPFNPETDFYNPLSYCNTTEDIVCFTKLLLSEDLQNARDPFWPNAAQILANALVGYLVFEARPEERTLEALIKLLRALEIFSDPAQKSTLDIMFEMAKERHPNGWHIEQYELLKKAACAEKTYSSIVISLIAAFSSVMSEGIKRLTAKNTIDIRAIGKEKTVVYVKSSDSDRSRDRIISVFFQQAFRELFREADVMPDHCLKVHTHFFLDDLGTNLTILDLDKYVAACRSREISMSIILQAVGQIKKQYGDAYGAILGSCASLVFLGSNDINTCYEMSLRLNKPLGNVLYKDINDIFVFTQGENAKKTSVYDVCKHPNYKMLHDFQMSEHGR